MRFGVSCLVSLLVLLSVSDVWAQTGVTVQKNLPRVQTRAFDPHNPPADMPSLSKDEAAITTSAFQCEAQVNVLVTHEDQENGEHVATVRVEAVTLKLDLGITIWLPESANAKLKAHEDGHKIIAETYYQSAHRMAERIAAPLVGKKFEGRGPAAESASHAAMSKAIEGVANQYLAAVAKRAAVAQDLYDEITDHGRNSINEDRAIEEALRRAAKQSSPQQATRTP